MVMQKKKAVVKIVASWWNSDEKYIEPYSLMKYLVMFNLPTQSFHIFRRRFFIILKNVINFSEQKKNLDWNGEIHTNFEITKPARDIRKHNTKDFN